MKTIEANRTVELDEVTSAGGLVAAGEQESIANSPPPAFDDDAEEVSGQFAERTAVGDDGPRRAKRGDAEDQPEPGERGAHRPNVGPTRARPSARTDPEDDDEAEE